jgi:hypothetical protein
MYGMKHIVSNVNDIPAFPPAMDRRRTPDRRAVWRGGRRDSDWVNRPLGGLDRLEVGGRPAAWKRAIFSVLHLW